MATKSVDLAQAGFYFEGRIFWLLSGFCVSLSVFTSILFLVCAQLNRLQLEAEIHAPLNRPHPHLSIDGEKRAAAMDAVGVDSLSSWATGPRTGIQESKVLRGCNGGWE